jgi:Ca2+-binding RTX toxin-like protein
LPVVPSGPPADWDRAYSWGWGCSLVFEDLALTGTATPSRVSTGGVATFRLAVENRGDVPIGAAGLVALGGVLDGGARVVSVAATRGRCWTSPGPEREYPPLALECHFGSLFPNESVAVTLRLRATAPGELALRVSLPRPAVVGEAPTGGDIVRRVRVAGCTRLGTQGADVVRGSPRTDVLCGFDGDDRIHAGEARDEVYAGPGADTIVVRDGAPDYVSCGAGRDKVFADRFDRLDRDCELAKRR